MKRVLCVWLPHWPLEQLLDARPELKAPRLAHAALVLYQQQPRAGLRVVACSPEAAARGIRPGMPLAEAAALGGEAPRLPLPAAGEGRVRGNHRANFHAEPFDPLAARAALAQLAAWCEQFSPTVGLEYVGLEDSPQPESLFLDVTGLAPLFGGEAALVERVWRAFAQRGFTVRLALADTIGAAWAVARYGGLPSPLRGRGAGGEGKCDCGLGIADWENAVEESFSREPPASDPQSAIRSHTVVRTDPPPTPPWEGGGSCNPKSPIRNPQSHRSPHRPSPNPSLEGRGVFNPQSEIRNPQFSIIPTGETRAALAPLPIEALRLSDACAGVLRELGLARIGQLASFSRADLSARFGEELLLRYDQALGEAAEVIAAAQLPPEIERECSFEQPIARYEVIEAALARLLEEVADVLAAGRRGVQSLECRLRCEGGAAVSVSLGLFRPSAAAKHLLELVRMRMERLALAAAVAAVQIRVTATAPLECRQQELFADDSRRDDPWQLAVLVDRLSSRLGRERVLRAALAGDAQPEYAWRYRPLVEGKLRIADCGLRIGKTSPKNRLAASRGLQIRNPKSAIRNHAAVHTDPPPTPPWKGGGSSIPNPQSEIRNFAHRPLRLAAEPVELVVVSVVPDGPPLRFQFRGREHRVSRFWGPERIETGWWRGRPVRRDYYRVETATGQRYWLFRRLHDGRWFWQGDFD